MVINMPPLSFPRNNGLSVWLIWCDNCGSGDIVGFTWTCAELTLVMLEA